jgi:dTDP-4-amino-4,6-dideoxygalactose transaminase
LQDSGDITLPVIPEYAMHNGHLFYIVTNDAIHREKLLAHLNEQGIQAVFHYLPLHLSPYFKDKYTGLPLPESERYADCLLRLPFYYDLSEAEIEKVANSISEFFKG